MIQDGLPALGDELLYAFAFEDELYPGFGAWLLFIPVAVLPTLSGSAVLRFADRAKYATRVDGFGLVPAVVALREDGDFIQLTEWRQLEPDDRMAVWTAVMTTRLGF